MQYLVLAFGWFTVARLLPDDRRAARWWGAYGACSAVALTLVVVGMQGHNEPLRATGHFMLIAATLSLQRGLWVFIGRAPTRTVPLLALLVQAAVSWLGVWPQWAPLRIGVGSTLRAGLHLWMALALLAHARREFGLRNGLLCALPFALTGLLLSWRAWRALVAPDTVLNELNGDTLLNLGSSVAGLLMGLVMQLMLVGLVIVRLVSRLRRLSRHDGLTGLLNRRAWDEQLAHESQRARRLRGALSVLMLDVDNFKQLNDALGHAAGDRALQQLATLLAGQMREIDCLARWGGEEFVALLPGTSGSDALALAQRLCERVRQQPLNWNGQPVLLSTTIGVAEWRDGDDTLQALMARADAALYEGKRAGRDRAHLAAAALRQAA